MPSEGELLVFYGECESSNKENLFRGVGAITANRAPVEDSEHRLKQIDKLSPLPPAAFVLDVGAGCGFFLQAAKLRGYRIHGIDLDKDAIDFAKAVYGITIEYQTILEAAKNHASQFDLITAHGVLEHLSHPGDSVSSIESMMKPGGLFEGYVPNVDGWFARLMGARWYHYIPPEHLLYFNAKSLRYLLESRGLEVLHIGPSVLDAAPSFSWGIRRLIRHLPLPVPLANAACQVVKLIKRWCVYRPLSLALTMLGCGGNNLSFCARKP